MFDQEDDGDAPGASLQSDDEGDDASPSAATGFDWSNKMRNTLAINREVKNLIERQVVDVLNCGSKEDLMELHGVGPRRVEYIMGEARHRCSLLHPLLRSNVPCLQISARRMKTRVDSKEYLTWRR